MFLPYTRRSLFRIAALALWLFGTAGVVSAQEPTSADIVKPSDTGPESPSLSSDLLNPPSATVPTTTDTAHPWSFIFKGGWILIPILLTSVIALAAFLERWFVLERRRAMPHSFFRSLKTLLEQGRVEDALVMARGALHPFARILTPVLEAYPSSGQRLREIAEERGKVEASRLERPIEIVGTCSTISPLLGLFGTVVGMIEVFRGVESYGLGDVAAFASGIWQALITTAVGLAVAIPAFVFYKALLGRFDGLIVELEAHVSECLGYLTTAPIAEHSTQPLLTATQNNEKPS